MVPDGWRELTVDQIKAKKDGAIAIGPFGSRMKSDLYTSSGIPVIRGNNISDTRSFVGDFVYVSPETADGLAVSNVFPGDLVFPHRGAIGEVGIVPSDGEKRYILSTSLMKLTCDTEIVAPVFLFYFFRSSEGRHELLKNASTVGTPGIGQPLTSLRSIVVPLPPLPEQHAIARILGTLDDKVELNRRISETLQAIARAVFRSWFVDFDPVHAKAEGRDTGLPKRLSDLFSDSFEDSKLGEIPRGWRAGTAGEEFNITMGQSPPGTTYNEAGDGLPFFQGSTDFGFRFPVRRVYCTAPTRLAQAEDTLVSVRAPVGEINMAAEVCCVGRGVAAVRHKSASRSYTYYSMKALRSLFSSFEADGTVFGSINKLDFHSLPNVIPNPSAVTAFEQLAAPLDGRISKCEEEITTLVTIRDTLLPKLISGELRLPEVEGIVGGQF